MLYYERAGLVCCLESRGLRRDNVDVIIHIICCEMYKNNSQLQKNLHRLLSTPIPTIHTNYRQPYLIFFSVKPVGLPRSSCCFSELQIPHTCANPPQDVIVYEQAYANRRYSFSKYALYIASIYQTIPKFSINSFIYISGMLTKFGYGFQLRKNSVNDGIDTFKSTYENNI